MKIRLKKKKELSGYIFVAPLIMGLILFFYYPIIQSIMFSFGKIEMSKTYQFVFQGFFNYKKMFLEDANTTKLLIDSATSMIFNVPAILIVSFIIAILMKPQFKGRGFFRTVFFLPVVLSSGILVAINSSDILQAFVGAGKVMTEGSYSSSDILQSELLTNFLLKQDIPPQIVSYLMNSVNNIITIVDSSGIQILIFLSALMSISPSLYESSSIEGATGWDNFWKITIPMISPQILVVVIYTIIDNFVNTSNPMIRYVYSLAFDKLEYGYSSAISWIYLLIVLAVIGFFYFIISKFTFYYTK